MEDQRFHSDRRLAGTLQAGILMSALLLLAGIVMVLVYPPVPAPTLSLSEWFDSLLGSSGHISGTTFLYGGIFLLILTPVLRVAVALFSFAAERDWPFMLISLAILVVLSAEILLSLLP